LARLIVSPRSRRNLDRLIQTLSLPATTVARFDDSIRPLAAFPLMGPALSGRWSRYRYILGPWRWMLIVYEYDEDRDVVAIVTVQDARSEQAPTATR
jgi:plasmid stabilization system protein ParE